MMKRLAISVAMLLGALALLWTFSPLPPDWVETYYSRGLYPALASVVIPATDWAPWPLGLIALALVIAGVPIVGALGWIGGRRRGLSRIRLVFHGVAGVILLALVLYALFLILWGAGYRRVPLGETLDLSERAATAGEVERFLDRVVEVIERDYVPPERRSKAVALASLRRSLAARLEAWYGEPAVLPDRVKRAPAGLFLAAGSSGMILPFSLEAVVDAGLPEVGYLSVASHELAHTAGLASERDADFAGSVGGLAADEAYARYASALGIFRRFAGEAPRPARTRWSARLPAGALDDIRAIREAHDRHEWRPLARLQRGVYDAHLRLQGVKEGIRDYSHALRLLLAADRRGMVALPDGVRESEATRPPSGSPERPPAGASGLDPASEPEAAR